MGPIAEGRKKERGCVCPPPRWNNPKFEPLHPRFLVRMRKLGEETTWRKVNTRIEWCAANFRCVPSRCSLRRKRYLLKGGKGRVRCESFVASRDVSLGNKAGVSAWGDAMPQLNRTVNMWSWAKNKSRQHGVCRPRSLLCRNEGRR